MRFDIIVFDMSSTVRLSMNTSYAKGRSAHCVIRPGTENAMGLFSAGSRFFRLLPAFWALRFAAT